MMIDVTNRAHFFPSDNVLLQFKNPHPPPSSSRGRLRRFRRRPHLRGRARGHARINRGVGRGSGRARRREGEGKGPEDGRRFWSGAGRGIGRDEASEGGVWRGRALKSRAEKAGEGAEGGREKVRRNRGNDRGWCHGRRGGRAGRGGIFWDIGRVGRHGPTRPLLRLCAAGPRDRPAAWAFHQGKYDTYALVVTPPWQERTCHISPCSGRSEWSDGRDFVQHAVRILFVKNPECWKSDSCGELERGSVVVRVCAEEVRSCRSCCLRVRRDSFDRGICGRVDERLDSTFSDQD